MPKTHRTHTVKVVAAFVSLCLLLGVGACTLAGVRVPEAKLTVAATDASATLSTETLQITDDMREASFGEAIVGGGVHVNVAGGAVSAELPVTLTYTFETALDDDVQGTIAYWNEEALWWEPLQTTLSDDRLVLTAQTPHLSPFAWILDKVTDLTSATYNTLGRATGTQTKGPECAADRKPDWATPIYVDDMNGLVRWCYEQEAGNADVLVVKLVLNRNYLGLATSFTTPQFAVHGLLGENPPTLASMLDSTGIENVMGKDGYVMSPLGSLELRYSKEQLKDFYRTSDAPLIEMTVFPWFGVMSEMFTALKAQFGNERATFLTVIGVIQVCGGALAKANSGADALNAFKAVADCAAKRAEDIAKVVAGSMVGVLDLSWDDSRALGRSIGTGAGRLLVWWHGVKFALNLSTVLGDSTLDPINRQFIFVPSDSARSDFIAKPPAESCEEIYSPSMLAALLATGAKLNTPAPGLSIEDYKGMGSRINGFSDFLRAHADDFSCYWMTSSLHFGITTRIVQLTDTETTAVSNWLSSSDFSTEPLAGGTRYYWSTTEGEGPAGESHFLRGNLLVATRWSGIGPDGYTADIITQLDR